MAGKVNSGIGGQALIEGIMMRNKDRYAIAVRKSDKSIEIKVEKVKGPSREGTWKSLPFIRGVFGFADSLITGMRCLMYSAELLEDEEDLNGNDEEKNLNEEELIKLREKRKKDENAVMVFAVIIAVALAIVVFMVLPYFITEFLSRWIVSKWVLSSTEALIRVFFFLIYIVAISRMKDIRRTFMYHGAEHKCINCVENGMELKVENVLKSSRLHKRCGTSFLFFVILVSIVFIMFIQVDSRILKILLRIILLPLIAGISYEIIRFAGSSENRFVNLLSMPGLGLQMLTTAEPDASMAEVAIAAVEAVFDWKRFLREKFGTNIPLNEVPEIPGGNEEV